MIEDVGVWIDMTMAFFTLPFTIYGFTFSFWDVFLWTTVASLLIWFLGRLFSE